MRGSIAWFDRLSRGGASRVFAGSIAWFDRLSRGGASRVFAA
jgi:hypothetical protein